eukprot:TRINITY_DN9369_c0_g1_i11.p1 TRINITY_DN9369_c0_g1~~TRINITY_DN9369_c0_g1_i11.p1  ORF type:complete len:608 (+),score=219.86 TRINITY_DN9369_c0_g1_i11:633-2456(+)
MYGNKLSPLMLLYLNGNRNLKGLLNSEVPETLVDVLAANDRASEYVLNIVEAISNCSLYKPIAQKFANMGVVKDLMQILSEAENSQAIQVLACIEAIWNILEVGGKEVVDAMALEEIAIGLKKIFVKVIKQGFKMEDKWLRNELCILINYTLNSPLSHKYFLTKDVEDNMSFFEVLLKYATHDELVLQGELEEDDKLLFTSKEEDTEFKKLLWTSISSLIKEDTAKYIHKPLVDHKFITALAFYFGNDQTVFAAHRWQAPQLREMQLNALSVITNIIVIMPEEFRQVEGHKILIRFLSQYPDTERRLACSKAILNAARHEFFKKEFAEEGIMDILMDIIQNRKDNSLELREYAFQIFAQLCGNCRPNQKEFRRKGGIELILQNLSTDYPGEKGNVFTFVLAVSDCLWNAVFGNKRSELHFVDTGGVFTLLDLLESCDEAHKRVLVSSLSTILENPKAIPMFQDWKSAKGRVNASQLLIRLYCEEDERFGVKYQEGILNNLDRPLTPREGVKKEPPKQAAGIDRGSLSISRISNTVHASVGTGSLKKDTSKSFTERFREPVEQQRIDINGNFSESYIYKRMLTEAHTFDLRAGVSQRFTFRSSPCSTV